MKKIIEKIKNDKLLNLIKNVAQDVTQDAAQNVNVYLVGGAVRDFYLGKENFDKDIIVDNIDAADFAKNLADKLDASFVVLDEENKTSIGNIIGGFIERRVLIATEKTVRNVIAMGIEPSSAMARALLKLRPADDPK